MGSRTESAAAAVCCWLGDLLSRAAVSAYLLGHRLSPYDAPSPFSDPAIGVEDPHAVDWTVPTERPPAAEQSPAAERKAPVPAEPLAGSLAARMVRPL